MPHKPRILIVDDCKGIRKTLKRQLAFGDWEFFCDASARDGLVTLENSGPFDIVICDYFMPYMNGVIFLKKINQLWPDTFCILLTAYPECHEISQALQSGLKAAVLEKPWDDEVLQQFLAAVIADRQKGADMSAQTDKLQAGFSSRKKMGAKQRVNCWEAMCCGREPGGSKVDELGICQATIGLQNNGVNDGIASGRICWAVSGTLCGGETQGSFAKKFPSCLKCPFYREIHNLDD